MTGSKIVADQCLESALTISGRIVVCNMRRNDFFIGIKKNV